MAFKEIVSPTLTKLFVTQIQNMILSGEMKPGEKFPPERQLADQMKVSLSVINNGINELADKGLVKIVPRQGTFVEDYVRNGNLKTLDAVIEFGNKDSMQGLINAIVDFRNSCEPRIVALACKSITEEQARELKNAALAFIREQHLDKLPELAFNFHHALAIATNNIIYPLMTNSFKECYMAAYKSYFAVKGTGSTQKFFEVMAESVPNQDLQRSQRWLAATIADWEGSFAGYQQFLD